MIIPIKPFKIGDRIICIKKPRMRAYQCEVRAKATVTKVSLYKVWVKEEICPNYNNNVGVCYSVGCFKLHKRSMSFKALQHL